MKGDDGDDDDDNSFRSNVHPRYDHCRYIEEDRFI